MPRNRLECTCPNPIQDLPCSKCNSIRVHLYNKLINLYPSGASIREVLDFIDNNFVIIKNPQFTIKSMPVQSFENNVFDVLDKILKSAGLDVTNKINRIRQSIIPSKL